MELRGLYETVHVNPLPHSNWFFKKAIIIISLEFGQELFSFFSQKNTKQLIYQYTDYR